MGVLVGALAFGFLLALSVAMTVQSVRIARERDRADRAAEKAQAVNAFLLRVLETANPRSGKGTQTTILEGVDAAAPEIEWAA